MIIKDILFKIKTDLKSLFVYPDVNLGVNFNVDYDAYWKKRGRDEKPILSAWQKERADIISKIVKKGDVIMDIGCGDCALLKYLQDKSGIKGIGVDMSSPVLESAKKLGIEVFEVDIRDLSKMKNLPQVDYIMGLEILEHIPNPEELIVTMQSKVNKGMIFSFPNTGYWLHRLRLVTGRFPLQWVLHPSEHLRYWTVTDVKWWVNSLGYVFNDLVLYQGIPILNKLFPNLFGQGILMNIRKK